MLGPATLATIAGLLCGGADAEEAEEPAVPDLLSETCQAGDLPTDWNFDRPLQQEQYVRWWCANKANVPAPNLKIRWYPATYAPFLGCIIQSCDITQLVPPDQRDVVILEEPEHINWCFISIRAGAH